MTYDHRPRFFLQEKMLWQFAALCSFFLISRMLIFRSSFFLFLFWNLLLAWIPLWCAQLIDRHRRKLPKFLLVLLGILWLLFLPNAPYIVTDFIHLRLSTPWSLVLDIFLVGSFSILGFLLGIFSLELMKAFIAEQWGERFRIPFMAVAALLSGFAIFLGRFLRWNSWDIISNPLGLFRDIANVLLHPLQNPEMFLTTFCFGFAMIGASVVFERLVEYRKPAQKIRA